MGASSSGPHSSGAFSFGASSSASAASTPSLPPHAFVASLRRWPLFTQQLSWVATCFALAVAPHLTSIRPWLTLLAASTVLWRFAIELRQWPMPNKWLRGGIAFAAMLGVLVTYRTLNGIEAGTAFLVVMGSMKLLETRTRRDLTIVLFVSYFLLFAGFLYDQQVLLLPYMLVVAWLLTATLMRIHQGSPMQPREALGASAKMLLQALPLAALLFLLFPRLPGQFWAVPARQQASTGIDDEVSPGDVSELSVSGRIAFRVKFASDRLPPRAERYWRGPVLHDFDGRTWRRPRYPFVARPIVPTGDGYTYRLMLEPHNRPWLFALDAPTHWPEGTRRTFDYQLVANRPVANLTTYELQSATTYRVDGPLPRLLRAADLHLPPNRNPRSIRLAQQLRAQARDDAEFVAAVLRMFREQEYFYTLEPPRLEQHSVDDFLFTTRRGFCEHFASAFTMLARAAGIPARVVVGYHGGELNPLTGYLTIRQSDAHAWSEVWLEERGWVRVDPTAAVAPQRIEGGLDAAIRDDADLGRALLRNSFFLNVRNVWDAANTFWNDNVIHFSLAHQRSLLERLGFEDPDWRQLGFGLVAAFVAFFGALSLYLVMRYRPPRRDPLVQAYERLCARFAKQQLARAAHEGPSDYLTRLARARPELAAQLHELRDLYVSLRYGPAPLASELSRFKFLVNQLRA